MRLIRAMGPPRVLNTQNGVEQGTPQGTQLAQAIRTVRDPGEIVHLDGQHYCIWHAFRKLIQPRQARMRASRTTQVTALRHEDREHAGPASARDAPCQNQKRVKRTMTQPQEDEGTSGTRMRDWRAVAAGRRGRQMDISQWVEGVEPIPHDHRFDVLWESEGLVPPCKRKPTEPGYEPVA